MTDPLCPFCDRDPFHYVNNGVGMEAVAVTCCEMADLYFRGARPAPEEVTLSWEEFTKIGQRILDLTEKLEALDELLAALIEAERFLDYFANGRTHFVGRGTPKSALQAVRAAIAKAEGPNEVGGPVRSEAEPAP